MSPLDAVAAALRERILAGRPAPLPGLGTLVRQHVPARVEERPDGTRVLLPPGETIGLGPAATGDDSLAQAFAAFRGVPEADADARYARAMDQVEAVLAATGEVRLVGVGLLRRTSGGIVLGVEADLLAAVNRRYEGLAPVETAPRAAPIPLTPVPKDPATAPAKPADAPAPEAPSPEPASITAPLAPGPQASPAEAAFDEPQAADGPAAEPEPDVPASAPTWEEPDAAPAEIATEPEADTPEVHADAESWAPPFEVPTPEPAPEAEVPEPEPSDPFRPAAEPAPEPPPTTDAPPPAPEPGATDPFRPRFGAEPAADLPTEDGPSDPPTPEPADEPTPLAVPFGAPDAPPLADVLPPTPPDAGPAPELDETFAPPPPPEDWSGEAWAAPAVSAPHTDDFGAAGPPIEEADFDVVDPEADGVFGTAAPEPTPTDEPPAFAAPAAPPPAFEPPAPAGPSVPEAGVVGALDDAPALPLPPGAPTTAVPIEVVPPAPEFAQPPAQADVATLPVPPSGRRARAWPWVLLILLVAAAAAAFLFWDQIAALVGGPEPGATFTASAEPAPAALAIDTAGGGLAPLAASSAPLPDSVLRTGQARPVDTDVDPEAAAAVPAVGAPPVRDARPSRPSARTRPADDDASTSTQPALGRAPAANVALLPPRLAGLSPADRSALSGDDAIDPSGGGFSLVVLSTPARAEADPLVTRWRRAGYRAAVLTAIVGGRAMYRVVVGQFSTREQALRLRDRVGPQAPADTWLLDLQTL